VIKNIDLKLNYPVLPGQDIELQSLFKSAFEKLNNFSSVSTAGGNLTDREIASTWLSHPEYLVDPQDVYLASGGHQALFTCILATGLQHKKIVVEEFTYSNFKNIARLLGVTLIPCAVDVPGLKTSCLSEICLKSKPAALYIMPTLNNPLGTVMPMERRIETVAIARKNDLLIIEDDAYGFLDETQLPNFFHLAPERCFYIYSFSKPFARGIKTSYLLAPGEFSKKMTEVLGLSGANPSPLFSLALNNALGSGLIRAVIREKQKEGSLRQQKAKELLRGYNVYGHKNGWHLWLELPTHIKASELDKKLIKQGVLIAPSTNFSASEILYDHAIRIAFGGETDFNKVVEGIEIIKKQIVSY